VRRGPLNYSFETGALDYGNRSLNNSSKKGFARAIDALISDCGINTGKVGFTA
jgi:hypothetical protein